MSLRRAARKVAKALVFGARANPFTTARALRRIVSDNAVAILCFHRVSPPDGSSYVPLDPQLFDDILRFCRTHGDCHTIAELAELPPARRPRFVISFDDGYHDFLDHSLPLLRKHGIRCNHNFIPDAIDSGRPPLNVYLQDFIGKAPAKLLGEVDLEGFGRLDPASDRERLGLRASAYLKALPIAEQKRIMAAAQPTIGKADGFAATRLMTREELQQVAPELEVGAHSFEHATLAAESDDYVRADARRCRAWFADVLGSQTSIYALPNGAATERQRDILREEGYSTILRVEERWSEPAAREHHRLTMYGDTLAELKNRTLRLAA